VDGPKIWRGRYRHTQHMPGLHVQLLYRPWSLGRWVTRFVRRARLVHTRGIQAQGIDLWNAPPLTLVLSCRISPSLSLSLPSAPLSNTRRVSRVCACMYVYARCCVVTTARSPFVFMRMYPVLLSSWLRRRLSPFRAHPVGHTRGDCILWVGQGQRNRRE